MEVKSIVTAIRDKFNQDFYDRTKGRIKISYKCQMDCYEKSQHLDEANLCVKSCKKDIDPVRMAAGKQFSEKLNGLSADVNKCSKNEKCINDAIGRFRNEVQLIVDSLN